MDTTILIANIFSFVGAIFLGISTFSKQKNKILGIQVCDCIFNSIACILAGSYSGFTTNLISGFRNIVNIKRKMSLPILIVFIFLILVIGFFYNKAGWIGILPPIACVEYTIRISLTKTAQQTRIALLINICLRLIHDVYMELYPASIIDVIILFVTSYNIMWRK